MAATVTSRPDSLTSAFEPWPLAEQWPGWGALPTDGEGANCGLSGSSATTEKADILHPTPFQPN